MSGEILKTSIEKVSQQVVNEYKNTNAPNGLYGSGGSTSTFYVPYVSISHGGVFSTKQTKISFTNSYCSHCSYCSYDSQCNTNS